MSSPDPFGGLFGGAGGDLPALLRQVADLLQHGGDGPVNWQVAGQVARQTGGGEAPPGAAEMAAVQAALRLADLWLDPVTALPSGVSSAHAWTRGDWLTATEPTWRRLVAPVAERLVGAFTTALPEQARAAAGPVLGVLQQVGGLAFGAQLGQALGALSGEVLSASDVGVPLGEDGVAALLPTAVSGWARELDRPLDDVRLHVALREAAHQRLFGHVAWLRGHLLTAVEAYARGIVVDHAALERAVAGLDPTDPEGLQQALAGGLLEPSRTPEQEAALARLETLLALVEGWVDHVVAAAAADRLPAAAALREASRRRRASGGPAEQAFGTLVGLELRPRRLREAAELWGELVRLSGVEGRDGRWAHPDLLPSADDLDDPAGYAARAQSDAGELEGLDSLDERRHPGGDDATGGTAGGSAAS